MDDPDVPMIHTGVRVRRLEDESLREAVARLPDRPCCWCGGPTPLASVPAFRPSLGPVPLHALCASDMREAYLAWSQGLPLNESQAAGFRRLSMLGASHETVDPGPAADSPEGSGGPG